MSAMHAGVMTTATEMMYAQHVTLTHLLWNNPHGNNKLFPTEVEPAEAAIVMPGETLQKGENKLEGGHTRVKGVGQEQLQQRVQQQQQPKKQQEIQQKMQRHQQEQAQEQPSKQRVQNQFN